MILRLTTNTLTCIHITSEKTLIYTHTTLE